MIELLFGPTASWFTIPAIVGTTFFAGRVILMMVGGADADGFDGMDAADALDGDASSDSFQILSIQTIATFMMGFGWGGLGAYLGSGLPVFVAAPVGVVFGVGMVWFLARLLSFVMGLQASGTMPLYHVLESEGTVYTQVPGAGEGQGQIRVVVGDRERYLWATTEGDALPRDTEVKVVRVDEDLNRVEVERA